MQSFDDATLRAHRPRARRARRRAPRSRRRRAAFDTFNIDLMYALPGQDLAAAARRPRHRAGLRAAAPVGLPPDARSRTRVFATRRRRAARRRRWPATMLDLIVERTGGRRPASATRSRPSRGRATAAAHNLNYWQFGDYLGHRRRRARQAELPAPRACARCAGASRRRYMERALAGQRGVATSTRWRARDLPFEFMLNALRLREGFELGAVRRAHRAAAVGASSRRWRSAERARPARARRRRRVLAPTARGFDFLSDLQSAVPPAATERASPMPSRSVAPPRGPDPGRARLPALAASRARSAITHAPALHSQRRTTSSAATRPARQPVRPAAGRIDQVRAAMHDRPAGSSRHAAVARERARALGALPITASVAGCRPGDR
ncbi:MAG: hypothetical protein MZW92_57190 [Comamonadaceae bacterium]|nr:hypothetical protein [Comamonadaceae bacterium]